MIRNWLLLTALVASALSAARVEAHFLFLRLIPESGPPQRVEVYFSEQATAGDPQFVEKIAATKLWVQSKPGKFSPLVVKKGDDRLTAVLPEGGPVSVAGVCEYGVLTRNVPFLLRYYPKAVAGDAEAVNRLKPRSEAQFEIVPTFQSGQVTLVAMHRGKPIKDALFTTIDDDLVNEEIKADATGRALWKPKKPGYYCVYTRMTLAEPGELKGQAYTEIREFATLSFAWPMSDPSWRMGDYLKAVAIEASDRRAAEYEKLKTPEDLAAWQQSRREYFVNALGGFPDRTPLNPQVTGSLEHEGIRVEKIIFESQPKHYVTAALYLPATSPPHPAVIVPCGHSANGKASEAYQRVCILLAKNGIAAMCYDPIGQGERYQLLSAEGKPQFGPTTEHTLIGVGSILLGTNTARYRIWDGMRAIDYLQSRRDIDPVRIGCTGNSGGGTLTSYLMALDDRIVCAAPSCYLTTLRRLVETIGPQDAEQNIHGQIAFGMDHADYVLMRAPLPTLMCVATRDYFDIGGAWHTFREAKRFYTRMGYSERMDLAETDATHGFSTQLRVAAVRWLRRWLVDEWGASGVARSAAASPSRDVSGASSGRGFMAAITEPDFSVLTDEQLQCTPQGQVMLLPGARSVIDLNRDWEQKLAAERRAKWQSPNKQPLLAQVRQLSGVRPLSEIKPKVTMNEAAEKTGASTNQTWRFEYDHGLAIEGRLVRNANAAGDLYLYTSDEGAAAASSEPVQKLVQAGHVVLVMELRGLGSMMPKSSRPASGDLIGADSKDVFLAYLLGKSYVGMRAEDVLAAARALGALDGKNRLVHAIAVGDAGPAALHAVALEPQLFASLRLERSLANWSDAVRTPTARHVLPQVVHGALVHYDLPDLVGAIPKEKIAVVEPIQLAAEAAGTNQPGASQQAALLKTFRDEFLLITPGKGDFPAEFTMGSADGPADERPPHRVTLKHSFHIAKYEVPQNLWEAVVGDNPSKWKGPRNSVEMLSFDEAAAFCRKATEQMRAAGLIAAKQVIRLPSEAEWEYVARAGTRTRYSFGDDAAKLGEHAWYTGNAAGNDPPVGAKKPNPWGLYDVHGYLWEWCADHWHENYGGAPADGSAWTTGGDASRRVLRSGSWKDKADRLTSTARRAASKDLRGDEVGLRCVLADE